MFRKRLTLVSAFATLALLTTGLAATADCGACQVNAGADTEHDHEHDIVETAVQAGNFSTLAAALQAADLVETLQGDGPFTVFAPTDEAFAKLPEGTVESLLQPENKEKLRSILLYHVVSGEIDSATVVTVEEVETVQGATVGVEVKGDAVMLNDATVTSVDIEASNGVIHVIDTVLMPPTE